MRDVPNLIISFPVGRTFQQIGSPHDCIFSITLFHLQYCFLQMSFLFCFYGILEKRILLITFRCYLICNDLYPSDPGMWICDLSVKSFYCIDHFLDKVAASLEYWKYENEKKEPIPLCLVDFKTLDIYSLQDYYRSIFIRDLDKVAASLEYWKYENEKKEPIPLCLVDFKTLDIYSLQDYYRSIFIRDYYVEMEFEDNSVETKAFYLPIPLCLVDFKTLDIYSLQDYYRSIFIRDYYVEMEFEDNSVETKAFYLPERL